MPIRRREGIKSQRLSQKEREREKSKVQILIVRRTLQTQQGVNGRVGASSRAPSRFRLHLLLLSSLPLRPHLFKRWLTHTQCKCKSRCTGTSWLGTATTQWVPPTIYSTISFGTISFAILSAFSRSFQVPPSPGDCGGPNIHTCRNSREREEGG